MHEKRSVFFSKIYLYFPPRVEVLGFGGGKTECKNVHKLCNFTSRGLGLGNPEKTMSILAYIFENRLSKVASLEASKT